MGINGQIPWNKGKKMPSITGKKNPFYGKTHSKEALEKMSPFYFKKGNKTWNKGSKHKPESIIKMREKKLGVNNPRFGKKNSLESNEKNRLSQLKRTNQPMKGKKHKPETILKMKESRKNWSTPFKDTSIELKVQELLTLLHIPFRKHFPLYHKKMGYHQVDIMLVDHDGNPKLAIECDGCYWHGCPEHHPEVVIKKKHDKLIDESMNELGITLIRFWEHDIKKNKIDLEIITKYV